MTNRQSSLAKHDCECQTASADVIPYSRLLDHRWRAKSLPSLPVALWLMPFEWHSQWLHLLGGREADPPQAEVIRIDSRR